MSVRFGIISDVHIGYRQYGLEARWHDFNKAFSTALFEILKKGIKDIVIAGDLLHQARPTARTIKYLKSIHNWLVSQKVRVYVIPGNHDLTDPHWLHAIVEDENNCGFILRDNEVFVIHGETEQVSVFGVGFMSPDLFRAGISNFPEADVILSHQGMVEFTGVNRPTNLTFDDYHPGKYKLAIIGDTHITAQMEKGGTTFLSPGSTEMNSGDESPEKYYHVAEYENGKFIIHQFPLTVRQVLNYENVKTPEDVENLIDEVRNIMEWDESKRATLIVNYDRECRSVVSSLSDLQRQYDIIVRTVPMPVTGKDPATFTKAEGRSLVEIAKQDVDDPEAQDLIIKVLSQPDDTSTVMDEWVDQRIGTPS